jgi:hypothetical protein
MKSNQIGGAITPPQQIMPDQVHDIAKFLVELFPPPPPAGTPPPPPPRQKSQLQIPGFFSFDHVHGNTSKPGFSGDLSLLTIKLKKSSIKRHPILSAVHGDTTSNPAVIHASGDETKQYILTDDLTTSPESQSKTRPTDVVYSGDDLRNKIKEAIKGANGLVLNLNGKLKKSDFTKLTVPYSLLVITDDSDAENILKVIIEISGEPFLLDLHKGKFVVLSKYDEPIHEDSGSLYRPQAISGPASKAPNSRMVVRADIPTQIPKCADEATCKAELEKLVDKLNYATGEDFIKSLESLVPAERDQAIQYAAHALAYNVKWNGKKLEMPVTTKEGNQGIVYNTFGNLQLQSWSNGKISHQNYVEIAPNWNNVFPYTKPVVDASHYAAVNKIKSAPPIDAASTTAHNVLYTVPALSGQSGAPAAVSRVDNVTYAAIAHHETLEEYQEKKKVFTGKFDKTVLQNVGDFLFAKKGTDYFLYKLKQQSPPIYLKYEITINDSGTYTLKNQKSKTEFVTQQTVASIIEKLGLDPGNVIIPEEETYNHMRHDPSQGGTGRATKKRRKAKRGGGARTNKRRKSAVKSRKRGLSKNKRAKRSRKAFRRNSK